MLLVILRRHLVSLSCCSIVSDHLSSFQILRLFFFGGAVVVVVAFLPCYFLFVCLQISTIPYLHMVLIGILRAYFILMLHTLCYIHICGMAFNLYRKTPIRTLFYRINNVLLSHRIKIKCTFNGFVCKRLV